MARRRDSLVHEQVDVAAPVPELDVGEAVPLLRERAQALGEHVPLGDAQAELAAAAHEDVALGGDDVAQIRVGKGGVALLAEPVERRVELEPARAVGQVEEHRLAVAAAGGDPARERKPLARLGARFEVAEARPHVLDGRRGRRAGRIRIDAATCIASTLAMRSARIRSSASPLTATEYALAVQPWQATDMRRLALLLATLAALAAASPASAATPKIPGDDLKAIRTVLRSWVPDVIGRRDPLAAYNLATDALRSTTTRAQWKKGDLPVTPYPANPKTFGIKPIFVTPDDVIFDLMLQPRKGTGAGVSVYTTEMQLVNGHWLVASMYPTAEFASPQTSGRSPPHPISARTSRACTSARCSETAGCWA